MTLHAGVTSMSDSKIGVCLDADSDDPVCIDCTVKSGEAPPSYKTAIQYLEGIQCLLEYIIQSNLRETKVTIHFDNLLAYNILTRYLEAWQRQYWHTSRNKPVPAATFMKNLHSTLEQCPHVTFHHVSESQVDKNKALRRIKKASHLQ